MAQGLSYYQRCYFIHVNNSPAPKNLHHSLLEKPHPVKENWDLPGLVSPAREEQSRQPSTRAVGGRVLWSSWACLFRSLGLGTRDWSRFALGQRWVRRPMDKVNLQETDRSMRAGNPGGEGWRCVGGQELSGEPPERLSGNSSPPPVPTARCVGTPHHDKVGKVPPRTRPVIH